MVYLGVHFVCIIRLSLLNAASCGWFVGFAFESARYLSSWTLIILRWFDLCAEPRDVHERGSVDRGCSPCREQEGDRFRGRASEKLLNAVGILSRRRTPKRPREARKSQENGRSNDGRYSYTFSIVTRMAQNKVRTYTRSSTYIRSIRITSRNKHIWKGIRTSLPGKVNSSTTAEVVQTCTLLVGQKHTSYLVL